jgi:hypothetical protein
MDKEIDGKRDPIRHALDWALEDYESAAALSRAIAAGDVAASAETVALWTRLRRRAAARARQAAELLLSDAP